MNTQTYNVQEDEKHLKSLLQAVASGVEIIIAEEGKPMARLSSVEERPQKILFGVLKGKVKVSDDFDAPLPESVLAEFEGNECDF
ncbi:MAG: type II toxin-antitoxin system Phd/YefM family antitoxin [Deltaproteobacteria bacterium]|jgi:antitoxin (DNA-binding transcriptional repressor) of toxin-antitoxin stability system|nr:MAG: type II toxin-antitoxin system Phd/YefM family antitoxin [Deltaproteobacteria bacterium]